MPEKSELPARVQEEVDRDWERFLAITALKREAKPVKPQKQPEAQARSPNESKGGSIPQKVDHNVGRQSANQQPAPKRATMVPKGTISLHQSQKKGASSMAGILRDPWIKTLMHIILFLACGYGVTIGFDFIRDWSAGKRSDRAIADAKAEKLIAEIKTSTPVLSAPIVEQKATSVAAMPVSTGPVYNCNGEESVQAGFQERTVYTLPTTVRVVLKGCTWLSIISPVSVSGSGYRIELPVNPGENSYYSCPTSENPDCTLFLEKIRNRPNYHGKPVRVLLTRDGEVTFNPTGG